MTVLETIIRILKGGHRHCGSDGQRSADDAVQNRNAAADDGSIDDETMAAVIAAVSIVMEGRNFRIKSVRETGDDSFKWIMSGRRNPFRIGGWIPMVEK